MSDTQALKKIELLEKELASLTDELLELKREHRAQLDDVHLELETIKLVLAENRHDFATHFAAVRQHADREIAPE